MEHIFIDAHKRRDIKTIFSTKALGCFVEGAGMTKSSKKYNFCVEKVDLINLFVSISSFNLNEQRFELFYKFLEISANPSHRSD